MDFMEECRRGNLKNIKNLVEKGFSISTSNYLPLRIAALYGYFEMVKYLVEKGSDISIYHYQSLRYASRKGHLEVVNYLRKVLGDEIPCHECLVRSACLELCF